MARITGISIETKETDNSKKIVVTVKVEYTSCETALRFALHGYLHPVTGTGFLPLSSCDHQITPHLIPGPLGCLTFILEPDYHEVVSKLGHDIYYEAHLLAEIRDRDNSSVPITV